MMTLLLGVSALLTVTSAAPGRVAAQIAERVAFFDGTFNDSDWRLYVFQSEPNSGVSNGTQLANDGEPQPSRRVGISINGTNGAAFQAVYGVHINGRAYLSPGQQGAILSLDYSEQAKFLGTGSGDGQATGPALRQALKTYIAPLFVTRLPQTWTTISQSGLQASHFVEIVDLPGSEGAMLIPQSHPDFSQTGSAIEFGFFRANSARFAFQSVFGIDNWSMTLNLARLDCTISLDPPGANVNPSGGRGTVDVTTATGCSWTATTNDNWIYVPGMPWRGFGSTYVNYSVQTNPGSRRTGAITIGGREFAVVQEGRADCTFSVSPATVMVPAQPLLSRDTFMFRVTTTPATGCEWTWDTDASWIRLLYKTDPDIVFEAQTNTGLPRTGRIFLANQTVTVTQAGLCAPDQYQFSPGKLAVTHEGIRGQPFDVVAPAHCAWRAISRNPDMIGVLSDLNTGTGRFEFTVFEWNSPVAGRVGIIDIAGNHLVIEQLPEICFLEGFAATDALALTRSLRDRVLEQTPRGRDYKRIYYEFSPEALRLATFHPTLLWRAANALQEYKPIIESMLNGTEATLSAQDMQSIDQLLRDFASRASPEFGRVLRQLRRDLHDPQIQEEFHVRVVAK